MSGSSQKGTPLHERLLAAVGDRTYRAIATETGHNPETARRYMQGHAPSAEFLGRICEVYDVNAHWLMTGAGPMRQSESRVHNLREASPGELLTAVADTLEHLLERVDRLEIFVQTLEARVRAREDLQQDDDDGSGATTRDPKKGKAPSRAAKERARRIAGAAAKRSPADAD